MRGGPSRGDGGIPGRQPPAQIRKRGLDDGHRHSRRHRRNCGDAESGEEAGAGGHRVAVGADLRIADELRPVLGAGRRAAGLSIALYRVEGDRREHLKTVSTNSDGRCDAPLLAGDEFAVGEYEIVFAAGDYLRRQGLSLAEPAFLDRVPIRFGIAEQAHYHVPLLLSPYGYSTYRGS